jgi:hypothetical protein
VQIVAYVDVDAGHTWAGHFLTEGSMACIATCRAVIGHALPAQALEAVVAFSGTFDAAERFVVVWFHGNTAFPEADWVRLFEVSVELAGLSLAVVISLLDWLVASYMCICLLI